MTLLHEAVDAKKLDIRLIERNVARGILKHDELRAAVQQLPDDSANADWINIETLTEEPVNGMASTQDAQNGAYGA